MRRVTFIEDKRKAYRVLVVKPLGGARRTYEDNIKLGLKEI